MNPYISAPKNLLYFSLFPPSYNSSLLSEDSVPYFFHL